jgi:hypothetical protein
LFPSTALWKVFPNDWLASFSCIVLFIKWAEHRLNPWVCSYVCDLTFSMDLDLAQPICLSQIGFGSFIALDCTIIRLPIAMVSKPAWAISLSCRPFPMVLFSLFLSCLLIAGLFTVYTVFVIG